MPWEKPTPPDNGPGDTPVSREGEPTAPPVTPRFSLRLAIGVVALFAAIMMLVRFVGEDWSARKQLLTFSIIFAWGCATAIAVLLAITIRGKIQQKIGRPIYEFSSAWVIDFQAALVSSLFCYLLGAVSVVFLVGEKNDAMIVAAAAVACSIGLQIDFLYAILFPVQVARCEQGLCLRGVGIIRFEHIRESRWTDGDCRGVRIQLGNLQITMCPEYDRRIHTVAIPVEARCRVDQILAEKLGDRHASLEDLDLR